MLICKVRKMRFLANEMTQQKLSEKTGIAVSTLSAYENNKRIPNAETLWILASALDCKVDDLYEAE